MTAGMRADKMVSSSAVSRAAEWAVSRAGSTVVTMADMTASKRVESKECVMAVERAVERAVWKAE